MPYNPALPVDATQATAAQMRGQLQGLFDLIQATPVGPPGPIGPQGNDGAQGPPISNGIVDSVTSVNPGEPATASVSFDGTNIHFSFGIPRGTDGAPGPQGPMGASISGAIVDFTTTVNPGQPASASASFDGANVRFLFAIPRGADGTNGSNGNDGAPGLIGTQGPQGIQGFDGPQGLSGIQGTQGPPGEVTNAALASAIAGTSSNTNTVGTLDTPFSNDPPTPADIEVLRAKVNEMILAMRR